MRHVPLVGDVAAGTDVLAEQNVEDLFPLPVDFTGDGELFMLRVRGDSMIDAGILNGDFVVAEQQSTAAQPVQPVADWRSVQITSRADAQLMLEKAKQYFAQYEPSHPAPLMIERVQRLSELNFMDIIRDLAPDGVNQLENIFGRRE